MNSIRDIHNHGYRTVDPLKHAFRRHVVTSEFCITTVIGISLPLACEKSLGRTRALPRPHACAELTHAPHAALTVGDFLG
jgi:hypothetical protein